MLKAILQFGLTRRAIVVLGVIIFVAAGLLAFSKLNIEAYPNPAPVILEITAQAAGLSAEEMEKYYTIPMEIALYPVPGVINVRSTSFYGLSFVRVTFKYGVDYYFAYQQAAIALQQGVTLPGNQSPQIQQSSLTGEIYRYQIKGPPNFGLTNLRTIQDYIVTRRMLTIPGVVQINSWGGTTKQFNVDVDPQKLEAYNVTIPQIITAIGNANVNVGGREIQIGQQSINIRGVGLIDDGGNDDLTRGTRTEDIENIVLSQTNGVPVQIKDVAKVNVGYVPRLGIAGRDHDDDIAAAILLMGRTQHTNDVLPLVEAEAERLNHDGTLPPGVKIEPYYDRSALVEVTTHTVLHNLFFGCPLVFLIQWIFLGDLRSAIIVGVNIPFALFFAIIMLVMRGEDANLLSVGAVDFGIIVDSAVILVENIFRNFQSPKAARERLLGHLTEGFWGPDPTTPMGSHGSAAIWTNRLRLIFISALQVDKAVFFTATITVTAFLPLFTMTGVEGQIFGPMARTYGYALAGALIATFTVTPVLASLVLPQACRGSRDLGRSRSCASATRRRCAGRSPTSIWRSASAAPSCSSACSSRRGSAASSCRRWKKAISGSARRCRRRSRSTTAREATRKMREILLRHPEVVTVVSQHGRPDNGSDASPFSNVELFVPLKPFDQWPVRTLTKEKLTDILQKEFEDELPGIGFNFSQYIQDNVEEALSGVKGANSVKIVGPNLTKLEELADQVMDEMRQVRGVDDLGIFHVMGQPNLNIKVDRAKCARYGLNAGDVTTVVQAAHGRHRRDHGARRRSPIWRAGAAAARVPQLDREDRPRSRSASTRRLGQRLRSATRARVDLARYGRLLHLPRPQPALRADQIQRARPRPRQHGGRGAGARRQGDQAADGLSDPLGGRIRKSAAGQEAAVIVVPVTFAADPGAALWPVQLAARQPCRHRRHSLRDRRRDHRALHRGPRLLRFGGHRLHFALWRRGDGRHSEHHLLPRADDPGHGLQGSDLPWLRAAHAADADDRAVGRRRAVPGRDLARDRLAGAASARHRRRRRHADRPGLAARRRAGAAFGLPHPAAPWRLMAARKRKISTRALTQRAGRRPSARSATAPARRVAF